jgi:hypothetical protein
LIISNWNLFSISSIVIWFFGFIFKFYHRSFNFHLFYFESFSWLIFFSISPVNIYFHLIFMLNLIQILLIAIFLSHFLNGFVFYHLIPEHLISFYFSINI